MAASTLTLSSIAIHYACPCTDISTPPSIDVIGEADQEAAPQQEEEESSAPFDPHNPRANFALYPLEHLLFCTECNDLRCQRCSYDEALSYFCPSCLNDRTSASVKTESNRCPQSCHQCPLCFSSLIVKRHVPADAERQEDAFILACPYCSWTTLDADLQFEQPVKISSQLAKALRQRKLNQDETSNVKPGPSDIADHFAELAAFYQSQLELTSPKPTLAASRFALRPVNVRRRNLKPLPLMREAVNESEGLYTISTKDEHETTDDDLIGQMAKAGWSGITNSTQRLHQQNHQPHLTRDVLPIPTVLRSHRAKRCRTCKHNLVRPSNIRLASSSSSSSSNRYRIRTVASSYIPRLRVVPLVNPPPPTPSTPLTFSTSTSSPNVPISATTPISPQPPLLSPGKPTHYLLTFSNPLYNPVRVTLATPRLTLGATASRVTILCPSFELPANRDIWTNSATSISSTVSLSRKQGLVPAGRDHDPAAQAPEAGKVWSTKKNATTVVLEIVPGVVDEAEAEAAGSGNVLQISLFVRLEYDVQQTTSTSTNATTSNASASASATAALPVATSSSLIEDARISGLASGTSSTTAETQNNAMDGVGKGEVAYWCIVELGRVGGESGGV